MICFRVDVVYVFYQPFMILDRPVLLTEFPMICPLPVLILLDGIPPLDVTPDEYWRFNIQIFQCILVWQVLVSHDETDTVASGPTTIAVVRIIPRIYPE